jgi:hypothetical protein
MTWLLSLFHFERGEPAAIDQAGVAQVLERHGQLAWHGMDDYPVMFKDTSHGTFIVRSQHCGFHLCGGQGPDLLAFVFDVAATADMVVIGEDLVTVMTAAEQEQHIPESIKQYCVLCTSWRDMGERLGRFWVDAEAFREARERVRRL